MKRTDSKKKIKRKCIFHFNNDYDPYVHRHNAHLTTDIQFFAHILKGIFGTGMLAIPEGFGYAGGLMAIVYSVVNGVLCTIGMHILIRGFYMTSKAYCRPVVTYIDAMRFGLAMGPPAFAWGSEIAATATAVFFVFYQTGVVCVYVLFASVTCQRVTNHVFSRDIPLAFYMLLMVIPCMFINSMEDLKVLMPLSYISLAATFALMVLIFYYCLKDPLPNFMETRKLYNDFRKLPMFFGTTVYAFTAVPVVVSIENDMKNPKNFNRIYNLATGFVLVAYLSLGFLSYWKWGDDLHSAVNLNFPEGELLAVMGNYMYAFAIFLSIALNGYVPVRLVMSYVSERIRDSPHPLLWEYLIRFGLMSVCIFMAITIPLIGELISLLGAIALSFLAFIFPSLLDISWRYQVGYGKFNYRLILPTIITAWGVFGLCTGVYVNIKEIATKLIR